MFLFVKKNSDIAKRIRNRPEMEKTVNLTVKSTLASEKRLEKLRTACLVFDEIEVKSKVVRCR